MAEVETELVVALVLGPSVVLVSMVVGAAVVPEAPLELVAPVVAFACASLAGSCEPEQALANSTATAKQTRSTQIDGVSMWAPW